jgi:uncharacterized protein
MTMKKTTTILILLLAAGTLFAQDIIGTWSGALETPQGNLRINFNISAAGEDLTSTLDSPDQNAFGIPVDSTFFKKPELTIKVNALGLDYKGTMVDKSTINGTLSQMGQSFEVNLKKQTE